MDLNFLIKCCFGSFTVYFDVSFMVVHSTAVMLKRNINTIYENSLNAGFEDIKFQIR